MVVDFIQLHKDKEPTKIIVPIKTNQSLKYIMEEGDAELIERVMERGDGFVSQLLDLVQYLEMEPLRKRLACGVALKLMRLTLEELKEEYGLEKESINEDEFKMEMKSTIEALKLIPED